MSFFTVHRQFYEEFNQIDKWFFDNTAYASKDWFSNFRHAARAYHVNRWNWGNYYPSAGMKNRFDNAVRQCIPRHQRIYANNLYNLDGSRDESQWFTTNWDFMTHALDSFEWNVDLCEVMDGWDDCYSTKECDEVAHVLQASLYKQAAAHRRDVCYATGMAGVVEIAGAAVTIAGVRRLFKSSGSRILALAASLAYPIAALVSNLFIIAPAVARITNV